MESTGSLRSVRVFNAALRRAVPIIRDRAPAPNTYVRTLIVVTGTGLLSVVVVFSFILLVQLSVLTIDVWIPTSLLHYFNLRILLQRLERQLSVPARLDEVTTKRFENNEVGATVCPGAVDHRLYRDTLFASLTAFMLLGAAFVLALQADSGPLNHLCWGSWPIPVRIGLTLAFALAVGVAGWVQHRFRLGERLRSSLEQTIETILGPLNSSVTAAAAEWNARSPEIMRLEEMLCIGYYRGPIESALTLLETELDHVFDRAIAIYTHLQDAINAELIRKTELESALRAYRNAAECAKLAALILPTTPNTLSPNR